MELVILRGLSGSGKSTYAKALAPSQHICSADDYFMDSSGNYLFDGALLPLAHSWVEGIVEGLMRCKVPRIVVDNTNTRLWEFSIYLKMAEHHGYNIVIRKMVELNPEVCFQRCLHKVPYNVIVTQIERFEVHPWDESI